MRVRRLRGHCGRQAEGAAGAHVDADSALLDRAAELALGDAEAARALLAARAAPPVRYATFQPDCQCHCHCGAVRSGQTV